jgi:flagellar hook-length control protein FliK
MSQPMPVAAAAVESGGTASRRGGAAAPGTETFGATLRDQMPGAAPVTPRAASTGETAAAPPAPQGTAEEVDAVDADAATAAPAVPELLLAQAAPPRDAAMPGLAHAAFSADPVRDAAAPPRATSSQAAHPLAAAALQSAGERRQPAADAARAGVPAAPARAQPGQAAAPGQAGELQPLVGAIAGAEPAESVLRRLDAALRPAAPSVQVSITPAAFAPLAAPAALPGQDFAPRLDALPPPLPPVDDPQWGAALGARLVWSAAHGTHSASLALNPPELGPVNVNLTLSEDEARVSFQSHHAAVRDAIEAALPRLRELFADGGLTLSEVDISAGDGRSGAQHGANPEQRPPAQRRVDVDAGHIGAAPVRLADGLVDTFA